MHLLRILGTGFADVFDINITIVYYEIDQKQKKNAGDIFSA